MEVDDFKKRIENEIREMPHDSIILLSVSAENYFKVVLATIMVLTEMNRGGVYVTVSRPYKYLSRIFTEKNIPIKNIRFIDAISSMAGERESSKDERCIFIENPASLEEIGMYVDKSLINLPMNEKFVFLDSLSTLLIYNNAKSIQEFSHFLINRLRLTNLGGIFISLEKEAPTDLLQTLIQMCDKVIKL